MNVKTISGDEIDTLINGGDLPPLEKVVSSAKPSTVAKAYASTAKTGYTPVEEKAEENTTSSKNGSSKEKIDFSFDEPIESDDSETKSSEVKSSEDKKDSK